MRFRYGLSALCVLAIPALAEAQTAQPQTTQSDAAVTYSANSACLNRLRESIPGFEASLSGQDLRDLRQLIRPAIVLARRGNEVACDAILTEIERLGGQAETKQAATPEQRQAEIAAARPISGEQFVRMQDIIGTDVITQGDEEIGEIEDFLIAPGASTSVYVLVDRGGFFDIGAEMVAVPLDRLSITTGGDVVIAGTAEYFAQAPQFESGEAGGREAARQADEYWAQAPR